jgi:hypothetical protein
MRPGISFSAISSSFLPKAAWPMSLIEYSIPILLGYEDGATN